MKRLLIAAVVAAAAGVPSSPANAFCVHSHGHPHAHSGTCAHGECVTFGEREGAECVAPGISIDSPLVDRVVCSISDTTAMLARTSFELIQC